MKTLKVKFLFPGKQSDWYYNYFSQFLKGHYQFELSDLPDYIFHAVHDNRQLDYDGIRIAFVAENVRPDFNISDYAIGFDHLSFEDRYLRFPLYLLYKGPVRKAAIKHLDFDKNLIKDKTQFCNLLVSNGRAEDTRIKFFELLSQYKRVDSGGSFRNNIGTIVKDKLSFQSRYKFSICFENSCTSGYLTEKLIEACAAKTIPIYWGDNKACGLLTQGRGGINPRAIVNIHDYDRMEDVVEVVKKIDQDDDLFISMLSEPFFLDDGHAQLFADRLENFLANIFDQPNELAYRRGFGQVRVGLENKYKRLTQLKSTSNILMELFRRLGRKFRVI